MEDYSGKADIWEELYKRAKEIYSPEQISPFINVKKVVCALEAEDGAIYTGFSIESDCGVSDLCAERTAAIKMYSDSGQKIVKRLIVFRDRPPEKGSTSIPCGACREFFMQLSNLNSKMEILIDYESREIITLEDLIPNWWGLERYDI